MHRRAAIKTAVAAGLVVSNAAGQEATSELAVAQLPKIDQGISTQLSKPIFIATWPFGKAACDRSLATLGEGGSLLDAVEKGIHVTELDQSNSSVGVGGFPNADGVVQLDASFMDGGNQKAGAVAALEGYAHPISVARKVMESTKHVMLAGADAAAFAKQAGFETSELLTDTARAAWQKWKTEQAKGNTVSFYNHDTIALLGLGVDGHLVGGCSTSGLAFKLPGRVGDSPIIGSGLYVDGEVGAAGATGVGENVMRYCASFLIVEFMRQGLEPTDACEKAIRRIAAGERKSPSELSVNFVAINKQGVVGAAGTDNGFQCAIVDSQHSLVAQPRRVE